MEVWEEFPPLSWQLKPWKRVSSPKGSVQRVYRPVFWETRSSLYPRMWALAWTAAAVGACFGERVLGEGMSRIQSVKRPLSSQEPTQSPRAVPWARQTLQEETVTASPAQWPVQTSLGSCG